ncbi:hypothetical protein GDO78_013662 [Eleutherodactylus coqui]|uniref:Uncharacterized protein n=1 Tax=Eleutherodactylus coqui TaxID=57060 RepID=A0A8J6C1M4_ELECQ|nr:hypothetical protein GDO78_013662 [Eleutherodactylus coqui]
MTCYGKAIPHTKLRYPLADEKTTARSISVQALHGRLLLKSVEAVRTCSLMSILDWPQVPASSPIGSGNSVLRMCDGWTIHSLEKERRRQVRGVTGHGQGWIPLSESRPAVCIRP